MARAETFKGYGPETGYAFLTEQIAAHDYGARGVKVAPDEIFVSDGAKSDTANIQEIFGADCVVALTDPVYPVYVDSNVMAGRAGRADETGRYDRLVYLPAPRRTASAPRCRLAPSTSSTSAIRTIRPAPCSAATAWPSGWTTRGATRP